MSLGVVRHYGDRAAIEGNLHTRNPKSFPLVALMALGGCGDVETTRSSHVQLCCFEEGVTSWTTNR